VLIAGEVAEENEETEDVDFVRVNGEEPDYLNIDVGFVVKHKSFGEGVVTCLDRSRNRIYVKFGPAEKTFNYPDAFKRGFLSL